MIKKARLFFLLSFVLLIGSLIYAGTGQVRAFDEQAMEAYTQDGDFAYMNLAIRPPSIWQRLQWWLAGIISRIFMNPNTPWLSDLVFYALLFIVIGVAIFYILRLRYGEGFAKGARHSFVGRVPATPGISQMDYEALIGEAIKNANYKLAIRYLYLKSLSLLAQKELITLKDWKSPFDYNRELDKELVPVYSDLSNLFEYVWYGDFNASHEDYEKGSQLVTQLQQRMK